MPYYDGLSLVNIPGTITQLLGAPAFGKAPLDDAITSHLGGPYKKVVLLLVDALGDDLFQEMLAPGRDLFWGRYFDKAIFSPITSISPSTTASALSTLWTGEGPATHGIIGYEMWSKELGMIINNILHSPASARNDTGGLLRSGFDPNNFIRKPLPCPKPLNQLNVYDLSENERVELGIEMLPGSLFEALSAFEGDKVLQDALGDSLTGAFLKSRYAEWDDFRTHVTDWEISRYLTTA